MRLAGACGVVLNDTELPGEVGAKPLIEQRVRKSLVGILGRQRNLAELDDVRTVRVFVTRFLW
jgi:hypothetical protein